MSGSVDRRRFLGLVGAATVGIVVAPAAGCAAGGDGSGAASSTVPAPDPAAGPTRTLRESLAVLAVAVRAAAPHLVPLGIESIDLGRPDVEVAAAVAALAPAMRDDFARGAVLDVGGWRLSETEARLALAAA